MKSYLISIFIFLFACSAIHALPLRSTPDDTKCLECHKAVVAGKILHNPMSRGCESCHKSNGQTHPQEDVKGFELTKVMPDLCYSCHSPLNTKSIIHAPVNNGKCNLCHTPHNSDNAHLLKENPVGNTCKECHDDLELDDMTVKHSPVEKGECSACHDPHQSDTKKLLKTDGQELCFSCHSKEKSDLGLKNIHPPFANKCVVCHTPHGSKEEYMLAQKLTDMCYACHDDLQAEIDEAKFSHKAVKEGKSCITCHSPHASANDSLLLAANMGTICISCHKLGIEEKKVKHAAVTQGNCNACHDPHKADNKNLVKDLSPQLCLKCHEPENKQMAMANVHPPFKNKCSICHLPHASDENALLKNSTREMCIGCHDDFEEPMQISKLVHKPLNDAKSCSNCHSPHASETGKLLYTDQKTLCLKCHSKEIKTPEKTIAGMKQLLLKSKYLHGAIDSTGCSGCHNPHFSDNDKLLVGKYKNDFYLSAVKDSVALCFNCHKSELLTAQTTTTATTFRNGDKNLHFIHVNGKKGRNCGVCHNVHASNQKHLLNESIPFGNWTMKITYSDKPNGGSCLTACHAEKSYTR